MGYKLNIYDGIADLKEQVSKMYELLSSFSFTDLYRSMYTSTTKCSTINQHQLQLHTSIETQLDQIEKIQEETQELIKLLYHQQKREIF